MVVSLITVLYLSFGCQNQTDKKEFESLKTAQETQDQNKEIARDVILSTNNNDFVRLNELLSDSLSFNAPGLEEPWNKTDVFNSIKNFYEAFPDWTQSITEIIAEGDKVVIKLTAKGTHKTIYRNIMPTDKSVTSESIQILTITSGKVTDWWGLEDNLGFVEQLGMELKPIEIKK